MREGCVAAGGRLGQTGAARHIAQVGSEFGAVLKVHAEEFGVAAHLLHRRLADDGVVLLVAEELVSQRPELAIAVALHLETTQAQSIESQTKARLPPYQSFV